VKLRVLRACCALVVAGGGCGDGGLNEIGSGCALLRFQSIRYQGTGARAEAMAGSDYRGHTLPLRLGRRLGTGELVCPRMEVPVYAIQGVRPEAAVGTPWFEGVFVRPGLCRDVIKERAFARCLRRG
jgi:hypothetical protein